MEQLYQSRSRLFHHQNTALARNPLLVLLGRGSQVAILGYFWIMIFD